MKTNIYSLAFGGNGVGKLDGKVCFVKGALPGEEVVFDVLKNTSRYTEGVATEIITPSEDRVEPVCPYYGRCGGCQLQHLSYEKELFFKQEQLVQLIKRISKIQDITCGDIVGSPDCYGYRDSVTLHRGKNGYGFYGAGSGDIVHIEKCPLSAAPVNAALDEMRRGHEKDNVTLKADHLGKVWFSDRSGDRFYPDRFGDREIVLSPRAFSQANRDIAAQLVRTLDEWIGPAGEDAAFFDAYCGVGFFSFLLGQDFGVRVGMDTNRVAIDCAKTTAKKSDITNARFYRGDAEMDLFRVIEGAGRKRNVLLLDPPRKGAGRQFLETVRDGTDITEMYYISCDPASLARDAGVLTAGGAWRMGKIQAFDMFPRTGHIEAMAEFIRTES